ncbi:MAG: ATP-dependent DNA helicase UvrD2 [Actinomycetota bacterium]|nr:ATP-dependent DNA helicase UvrD2 [Actinomycetota bacterium]
MQDLPGTSPSPPSSTSPSSPLLRGLNPAQHAAVTSEASPLRILAGAGSGKTRVLTHRIAYRAEVGTLDPNRVLAVTFTRKAAGELRERLGRLGLRSGVHAGTFHSIAYAQLRQRWEERGIRAPELLERKVGFVARLMSSRGGTAPLDVVSEIEWAAARRIGPEQYEAAAALARRRPPLEPGKVAEIYDRFMTEKRRRRLVDFDDLLRLAVRDLAADPVYAAARHWRFRHLFVDEFQDVNPLQHALLAAWSGPESDLCAVGDPNQAIYAWNGADSRYLIDFETYFPGSSTVTLEDNYRSTPEILTVANAVLDSGRSVPIRLRPHRPSGPVPTVTDHPDAAAEAGAIARSVRDRHSPGSTWSRQAVLVRTNAQATLISEAFTRAAIPHRVRGGGDLLEQPEIKQAISSLRRASSLQMALGDLEEQVRRATPLEDDDAGTAGPAGEAPSTVEPAPLTGRESRRAAEDEITQERAANVAELVRLGREYLAIDPDGGIPGFLGWMTSALRGEDRSVGDAVELVTFHAAKGLEWPIVHLAGLEEGFVPIHHAKDSDDDIDEERRLLYVALTRAREELHCTWARSREFGSRSLTRKPSPWLEIVASTVGMAPLQVDRREGARRARNARSGSTRTAARPAADDLDPADTALFEALRTWRKQKAKEADVPAYVIFNDATLAALATARPTSRAQLLRVSGLGAVKAQRFGDDVLRIVADNG